MSKRAVLGLNLCIDFEEDRVTLDIPMKGMVIKDGWKLTPMLSPTVSMLIVVWLFQEYCICMYMYRSLSSRLMNLNYLDREFHTAI